MQVTTAAPTTAISSHASPWARFLCTGHRGAAAYLRENSLASFALAVEMGATVLECDVRLTRDGALVLAHDGVVGRGRRAVRISETTLRSVWERSGRADLLTLADLLPHIRSWNVLLNVDLKAREAEVPLVTTLAAHNLIACTVVTSRASYQLRRLRALAPGLRLGLSKGSSPPCGPHGLPEWSALVTQRRLLPLTLPFALRRARVDAAYLEYRLVTPRLIASLHAAGFGCYAWTVDDPARAAQLHAWGIDGITTNRPDVLRYLDMREEAGSGKQLAADEETGGERLA